MERCEPNRSSRERCFCLMLLEMTRGPLVEGGEGCGDGVLGGGCCLLGFTGGGTHCFCCCGTGALFLSLARASSLGSFFFIKFRGGGLTGSKGLASGWGRLLNCLMISRMLEVGSGLGSVRGVGVGIGFGGSTFLAGGVLRRFTGGLGAVGGGNGGERCCCLGGLEGAG